MSETVRRSSIFAATIAVFLGLGASIGFVAADILSAPEGVPHLVTYEGYLTDNGSAIADGPHDMWFRFFTSASAGSPVWQLSQRSVTTTGGHFVVTLGDTTDSQPPLLPSAFAGGDMWLEVAVGSSTEVVGRQRVVSVPFALRAATAQSAANGAPVGSIQAMGTASVPTGWLACDGRAVRKADYPDLFASIGTTWGDGSTTTVAGGETSVGNHFNLPDLRGRFLRGLDRDSAGVATSSARDPDRDVRAASAPNGAYGNSVGSVQNDSFRTHNHRIDPAAIYTNCAGNQAGSNACAGGVPQGIATSDAGGSETRPANVLVAYVIKF